MTMHDATIAELTDALTEATAEATSALRAFGDQSLEFRNADFVRRTHERQLEAAKQRAEERDRRNNMTPSQIVDEVMGR